MDVVAPSGYIARVKRVGIRELKNRLSEYLRQVRNGEEILVTDRGEVVAELRKPGSGHPAAARFPGIAAMARRGAARLGAPNDSSVYPKLSRS